MTTDAGLLSLRKQLVQEGYFRRTPVRLVAELSLFVGVTLGGVWILLATESLIWEALAMWVITLAGMGVSTNAHTASHNAVSDRRWVNSAMLYFGFTFFLQVSAHFWRHKHLVIHHHNPNVVGVDNDIDLLPWFALSKQEIERSDGFRRLLYRVQLVYLPVLLVGNAFNVVVKGWIFLIRQLMDRDLRRDEHWLDLAVLLLHWVAWVIVPMLFLPALDVVLFNATRFALMSYGMFALFAPAHFPAEAAALAPGAEHGDTIGLQTVTTVNYRTGRLGRLICGGVEYQIEHHLFPSISPAHYPAVSQLVRRYCESNGYPYRSFGWGLASWKAVAAFADPKPVHTDLRQVRVCETSEPVPLGLLCDESA